MKPQVIGPWLLLTQAAAFAQAPADDHLRIPLAVLEDSAPEPAEPPRSSSVFVEANGEAVRRRPLAVPLPAAALNREVLRLLVDGRGDWQLGTGLTAKASARAAAARIRDGVSSQDEQFDLREAAVQWRINARDVTELGRVNLRHGAALGFNPTDYFKTRTAVDTSTRDPQAQRVNRLGTVMANAQRVGDSGSLLVAVAPRLAQPASLNDAGPDERLRLGDTNGQTRLLLKVQPGLWPGFNPDLLAFKDADGWRWGASLAQTLGRQTTWFVEVSGGRRKSLWQRALEDGVALGDLPAAALAAADPQGGEQWQHDVAAGWTWTGENRLSLTAEFDYHSAGFSRADWQRWVALGSAGPGTGSLAWYLRGYAGALQEPLFRRNLFLRAQWDPAGARDLTLNAFINRNLDDHSSLFQAGLEYRVSASTRLRALALLTSGRADTQYGSDPARNAFLLGCVHYF